MKLTVYFGERDRVGGGLVADALLDVCGRHRLATSALFRGTEGYGRKHHRRTDHLLSLSEDLPMVAVAVDTRPRIEAALPEILALRRAGLVTLEPVAPLIGGLDDGAISAEPDAAAKLTLYLGRQQRIEGRPAFVAVCELLHRRGIAGATALLGVDGTVSGARRRAAFFSRNAEVPMSVVAVASAGRIAAVLPELGGILPRPLVTLEPVRICKRDGESLAPPDLPPPSAGGEAISGVGGVERRQKLTIYTSEAARRAGRPIHFELIRRLRRQGAAGVTSLRGVWGFHGDHRPHGDEPLRLRRRMPVVTVVIDEPSRIADSFAVVDELTRERGLVTSEATAAILP